MILFFFFLVIAKINQKPKEIQKIIDELWIYYKYYSTWASLIAQLVKNLPATQETLVQLLGRKDPLEKG